MKFTAVSPDGTKTFKMELASDMVTTRTCTKGSPETCLEQKAPSARHARLLWYIVARNLGDHGWGINSED